MNSVAHLDSRDEICKPIFEVLSFVYQKGVIIGPRRRGRIVPMPYEERKKVIKQLQEVRGSKVISYVCGDKQTGTSIPGMGTQLASEPRLIINGQLNEHQQSR